MTSKDSVSGGIRGRPVKIAVVALMVSFSLLAAVGSSIGAAYASAGTTGTGSFADSSFIIVSTEIVGGKIVLNVKGSGTVTGAFTGPYTFEGRVTITPTGTANYHVIDTCTCTVEGRSGTLVFRENGRGSAFGSFESKITILRGTDGLANLNGHGALQGIQDPTTLLTSGSYSVQYQFK
ncbi:MAG: DUF3224 domain-containing protein [Thaumarchaeota archaeon]|nr:DUF3224 domain-containing protein [Nitrososphaerota archaeon]